MTSAPRYDDIVAALEAANLALDPSGQERALTVLRTLARGRRVSTTTLADRTGQSVEEAAAFIDRLPGVYRDDAGDVIGFWGLAVTPFPPHEYRVAGQDLYTWCAWDPFILTDWLGGTAEISSIDARSQEPISFRIDHGEVLDLSHPDLTPSFTLPDEWTADVIADFCHFIHFFTDAASARAWTEGNPGTFVLPLEHAIDLGRVWGRQVFPDLDPHA